MPPNRRTQWPTSPTVSAIAISTASGPCHIGVPVHSAAAPTSTSHPATTAGGWVPATRAPSVLPAAAATARRHAATAATRERKSVVEGQRVALRVRRCSQHKRSVLLRERY